MTLLPLDKELERTGGSEGGSLFTVTLQFMTLKCHINKLYLAASKGIEVVTNTLFASGYDFVVSLSPIKEADLYYVLTTSTKPCYQNWRTDPDCGEGTGEEEWCRAYYQIACDTGNWEPTEEEVENLIGKPFPMHDLSPEITALLHNKKPVIIHQVYDYPNTPGWNTVMDFFETSTDYATISDLPDTVQYKGKQVRFKGLPPFALCNIKPKNVGSDVILTGAVKGEEYALIINKDNKYLINGNNLHIEFSYVLANLLADTIQKPTFSYVVIGKTSAFFAAENTTISVKLPGSPSKARVVIFDEQGKIIQDKVEDVSGVFEKSLKKYWLMIVE